MDWISNSTNEELFIALKNIVKRRGISYLDDASEDVGAVSSDYGKAVEENRKITCRTNTNNQLERFENMVDKGDLLLKKKA